jgi:glycosyltransferase involved in cell wall biosynthesis
MTSAPELSVIIPVYNEEGAIAEVVADWVRTLDALGITFEIRLYDDGSRDGTPALLDRLAAGDPRLVVVHKPNSGHGPTILHGYREARGRWVFQVDSDNEMRADGFPSLWRRRGEFDLLLGLRHKRSSPLPRRIITRGSRLAVWLLFGKQIADVNTPYRLMRAELLRQILPHLSADLFAPNVLISGLATRRRWRIHQEPVLHEGRRTGTVSIVKWKLWKSALKALVQTTQGAIAAGREARHAG